jgi:hypothetical protein
MRKIDHHHCSGVPCDICGPDHRDAEIARLKDRANEALAACERKDREIARLKHTNEALEHVLRQYEKRHGLDGLIKGHIEAATIDQRHEIGMMLSDLARHKRALAAGPAALRAMAGSYDRKVINGVVAGYHSRESGIIRSADLINAALHVEAAQKRAMEEGK